MKCIPVEIVILCIFALAMQNCIKEELAECKESALYLRYRYTLNNQYKNLFGSEVRNVTLYVFDGNDKYVGSFTESGEKLTNDYVMQIPLPEDTYRLIAYGGDLSTYSAGELENQTNTMQNELRAGITSLNDFRLFLHYTEGQDEYLNPRQNPGDLYAGYVDKAVASTTGHPVTEVELIKDTKKIKVKVSGLSYLTRAVEMPEIYITALNGRYTYGNKTDPAHRVFKYTPVSTSFNGNEMEADLKTMRLVVGEAPMLTVKLPSAPEWQYHKNMIEQIMSNPQYVSQEDIDREDEFVFEINISKSGPDLVISLLINGWEINHVIPEMN